MMAKGIKGFIYDAVLLFLNYFVAYIPSWAIRKMFYRMAGMKIGKGTRIDMRVYVFSPWRISIGENTKINAYAILDGRGNLRIGSNVSVSMHSVIYTASHISSSDTFSSFVKDTTLKDCSWIGVNAVILPGTVIEERVIVAANSLIKGETMRGGIYLGIPAVFVRDRGLDHNYILCNRELFL